MARFYNRAELCLQFVLLFVRVVLVEVLLKAKDTQPDQSRAYEQ